MMKKIFMTALCALAIGSAAAQEATDKTFWSDCFVSVGGGVQMYVGDHDSQASFGDRLSPALNIAVGKWFTPVIGVRLMYSGLQAKGATNFKASHYTGKDIPGKRGSGYDLGYQKFNFFNLHADAMLNVRNWLQGRDESRIWNISPYVGIGWGHVSDSPSASTLTGNFGVLNAWRVCPGLDVNLDVHATLVGDGFDGEKGGVKGEGIIAATVGLTYTFK